MLVGTPYDHDTLLQAATLLGLIHTHESGLNVYYVNPNTGLLVKRQLLQTCLLDRPRLGSPKTRKTYIHSELSDVQRYSTWAEFYNSVYLKKEQSVDQNTPRLRHC